MTETDGERIRALEVRLDHLADSQDRMSRQVQDMHDLLMQAKGAKYIIIGSAAIAGALSAKLTAVWGLWK